ncbi:aspartate/tyrosine/aromatic aminotransferase [Owenweeksia hongkongensis DSM 17368]|uniref:Aspartate/tyrosine/aromatic aminotransferase n=1 Tax=Owenweeksia hongkongensis (strain DSM 17368 / CIP 108786 / JCM 12287 / NRRL B-23963 / UST20020801) TaxID=926562 RepID=G8R8R4_OWEHD|nr:pyridoxal phosphate-dependent aminotransferase [Owenweeksia hongkongensis]AEV32494.1 aspartate/tyrosine/aromatic aminotransferase [Owenweeksia hongkongensis DSM 17368]
MNLLSDRIQELSESQTIAMNRKSREMKENGIDVISLSLGEPDFNTPDFIKEAAKQAIDDNYTYYPPIAGYKDVREAISKKFKRDNGLDYSPEQIVVSTGAKQSIANVVLCTINPGDEVLLPAPYWVSYYEIVKLAGGIPVVIPTKIENDFKITGEELESFINAKTKMMIFSSPCNPSGTVYTAEELEDLAKVIKVHPNLLVISDEIYELINFEGKHASLAANTEIYDQVITINGVSKGFAMTGWRCGYIGAPLWLAKACDKMQGQFTSATCSITQRAVLAALEADPSEVSYMKDAFAKRRDLVLGLLNEIPGIETNLPIGAFYIFPNVTKLFNKKHNGKEIGNCNNLCLYLLEEAQVGLVPGDAFGSPNCIRISYAASEETLVEALKRIKSAIEKLS